MPRFTAAVRSLAFAVAALGPAAAAAQTAPAATVPFDRQSVEINAAARGALDTLAQMLNAQGVRQIELHGFATGEDAGEARKLALVRTLSVRSYLIDQGVKARIEVQATPAPARGGAKERVDVMTP
jgi:outer membrane protein OmpA-like peptidoglycan-associated protein